MISNCGHDENGRYRNGKPGDQTGGEYTVRTWYSRPWSCVLRYPDAAVGQRIADNARAAAMNNHTGYCQTHRLDFYYALKSANWDPAKITKDVEADCSSSTAAIIIATGHQLGIDALKRVNCNLTTYGMRESLRKAGFEVMADPKYLTSDDYLLPGDILLYDRAHVAVNLDRGSKAGKKASTAAKTATTKTAAKTDKLQTAYHRDSSLTGTYKVTARSGLMMRYGAGTQYGIILKAAYGTKVNCYGYYNKAGSTDWLYCVCAGKTGYMCSKYLVKI